MAEGATDRVAPAVTELFRVATSSPVMGAFVYALLAGFADDVRTMTLNMSNLDEGEIEQIEKHLRRRGMVRIADLRAGGTPN